MNRNTSIRLSLFASAALAFFSASAGAQATRPATRPANARPTSRPAMVVAPARPDELEASKMRSPQETIAAIRLPEGYHLELVASEPDIMSPVICTWDGNGRMYVAEMRSYMLDINGSKEKQKISRVIRLEDTRGAGAYDKLTVLADNLLLP